jgi:parallel beta-helix repeat protein
LFKNIGIKPDSNFININHQEYRSGVTRDPANGPKLISIIGNYFETCSGNGIDIIASIGVMIHNNILRDVTKRGISVTGNCSDITIQGNDVESKEHGITSTSAGNKYVTILDNRITAGIANSNFSALLVVGERNQVSGNHIKSFANGVFVSGATKTLVQGNHINNCSSTGIRFESTVATSSIMNNQMSDCPTAIRFDSTCSKISAFNNVGIDSPNGFVNTNLVTGYTEANNVLVTS